MRPIALTDRVIVRRLTEARQSPGGILLPESAVEKSAIGEVVSDGPDTSWRIEPGVKVLLSKFAGNDVTVDGQDFVILKEDEILAVLVADSE